MPSTNQTSSDEIRVRRPGGFTDAQWARLCELATRRFDRLVAKAARR